jgi:hypothetical protein
MRSFFFFFLFLFSATVPARTRAAAASDRVRLEDVKVLTLRKGAYTTGRRSAPLPQLECSGGNCRDYVPEVVQCYNVGSNGIDAEWRCESPMPEGISFGFTEVSCEGYDYPEDPFILRGSCQLVYELKGRRRQAGTGGYGGGSSSYYYQQQPQRGGYDPESSAWLSWAVLAVVAYLFYRVFTGPGRQIPAGGGGGYGGGGWGGGAGGGGGGGPSCTPAPSAPPAPQGGFNGFWGGLASGAGLGYLMGRRPGYGTGYARPRYGTGFGFGSGYARPATGGSSFMRSTSGSSSSGGGLRTQTTFASTRRR